MKVNLFTTKDIPDLINRYDKKVPEDNLGIFMKAKEANKIDQSTFDNDFLNHQLYDITQGFLYDKLAVFVD